MKQECGERTILLHFWWDCYLVQPLWKLVCWFLRKLQIVFPEDQDRPLLSIYQKDVPPYIMGTCFTMIIAAYLYSPKLERTPMSFKLGMDT